MEIVFFCLLLKKHSFYLEKNISANLFNHGKKLILLYNWGKMNRFSSGNCWARQMNNKSNLRQKFSFKYDILLAVMRNTFNYLLEWMCNTVSLGRNKLPLMTQYFMWYFHGLSWQTSTESTHILNNKFKYSWSAGRMEKLVTNKHSHTLH